MDSIVIKVGIVDDHTLFRDGLANLLSEHDNIQVLFKAKNGNSMQVEFANDKVPNIVLMDINMPSMNGHEATDWIKKHYPLVNVLALSMYEDDLSIIKMLRKGAGGYVLKESNTDEVVRAIRSIHETGYYLNELVSGRLIRSLWNESDTSGTQIEKRILSHRELEFLQLCCSELTYKEIAQAMKVSPRTVDGYRETLFEKLQLKSRVGLVLYAIKKNLISTD